MSSKRKQRELALQVLFVWDANADASRELAERVTEDVSVDTGDRAAALLMAGGAWEGREASDKWVERLAPQWPPRRQPGVDRNLIRLAMWELTHADTPPKVVIDEAIELARHFSTEQSPSFVNGVLDAVLKEITALKAGDGRQDSGDGIQETEGGSEGSADRRQEPAPTVLSVEPVAPPPPGHDTDVL